MSSYHKHFTIRAIEKLYNGNKIIHRKAQYLGFYKRVFYFFQNVHPNVKRLGYLMMRSKDYTIGGEYSFVSKKFKNHIERIIKFCYKIQSLKSEWLKDDILETDNYDELLCHLFVGDNIDFPKHFCDIEMLSDENYFLFFRKVGNGDKIWKWLPKLPFELTNNELYYFLNDATSFQTSIWSGVYYATITNLVENRTDYEWLMPYLSGFQIRKVEHREDILLFLIRNFKEEGRCLAKVIKHLNRLFQHQFYWQWRLKELDLTEVSDEDIYSNLVGNLFAKYSIHKNVPRLFRLNNPVQFKWFLHLASGFGLRSIPDFTYKLSKKEAQHFFNYNGDSMLEAYYYSKIMALGATDWQGHHFAKHIIKNRPSDDQVLKQLICFLIKEFPNGHYLIIGIIRYILLRFREKDSFSLKGRTAQSISKDAISFYKIWLKKLNREYTIENLHYFMSSTPFTVFLKELQVWSTAPILSFDEERYNARYEIRQINSVLELEAEGKVMHHCVGSYAYKCKEGRCSIWTFSKYNEENRRRRILTVEVVNQSIVQAKGTYNSIHIDSKDYSILMEWAKKANLNLNADRLSLKVC